MGKHPNSLKNLKPQRKGEPSINPGGRPPDALNAAMKKLTKQELEDVASMIIKGSIADLEILMKNKQTTVLKAMIAGVAIKTIKSGDSSALNALLDRLVGKVKDHLHHSGSTGPAPTVILKLPSNGREAKKDG